MKLIKRLFLLLLLLVALAFGAVYWWSVENSPPDALNQHQPPAGLPVDALSHVAGLYDTPDGEQLMLLPSAQGGLMLWPAGDYVPGHGDMPFAQMDRDEEGNWWVTLEDGRRQPVELFESRGKVTGMRWPDHSLERSESPAFEVLAAEFETDVPLSGTLFLPNTDRPVPGAVIIHGSGSSDRDNPWYVALARSMAENDVAVLLPDKRGSGRSGGEWRTASFNDFAEDALAAARVLEQRPETAASKVGMVGISQGGRVAPIAAAMSPEIAFAVSVSSAAVTPREQVRHEIRQQMISEGLPPWLTPALMPIMERMPPRRRPAWWRQNGDIDPLQSWAALEKPGLVIYGREDESDNVPVKQSVSRLVGIGKPASELKINVISDVGHSLLDPANGELHSRFRNELGEWIHTVADIPDPVVSACKGVPLDIGSLVVANLQLSQWEAQMALTSTRTVMVDSTFAEVVEMSLMSAREVGYVGTLQIGKAEPQVPAFAPGLKLAVDSSIQEIDAALVLDLRGALGQDYAAIDGLVGVDTFEEFVLDINMPGRCLRLIPRDRFRAPPNPLTVKRRNDRPVVDGAVEFGNGESSELLLLLDFALADSLRLEKQFVDDHGLVDKLETTTPEELDAGPGGEADSLVTQAGVVSVGNSIWADQPVSLSRSLPEDGLSPPWDGAIGIGLLKTRRVVYDPVEGRMWLLEPRQRRN